MNGIWDNILKLIELGEIRISEHGYDELSADGITAREIVSGVHGAMVVGEYPDYIKGPSVLTLQRDLVGRPVHVVWGIPRKRNSPAVLVTAYRPDPERWTHDFQRRRK